MNRNKGLYRMVLAALLCAIGIVIPMFSPIKVELPPASFTLASHVAIFVAMFISPTVAVTVALGTTLGFFLGGFVLPIVLRALSHVVFAFVGAMILKRQPMLLHSRSRSALFCLGISVLHAICEVAIILPLYFGEALAQGFYASGFFISIVLLVGFGTVVHSSVDFIIAVLIWRAVGKVDGIRKIATASPPSSKD